MRPNKLNAEQRKQLAERHLLYMRLRIEAAKHSPDTVAREMGISKETMRRYLNRSAG